MNDNSPEFTQPSFRCTVSEGALRGQFVSLVAAFDQDETDENKLIYSIVTGNDLQAFTVDATTGNIRSNFVLDFTYSSRFYKIIILSE